MRHTFRFNVHNKGYTLYSGSNSSTYQEFHLDMPSKDISRNYLSAQNRIDSLLETQTSRWSVCIINSDANSSLVTAYGCLLPIPDSKGRIGISFIHAIESSNELTIDQVIILIARLLSSRMIGQVNDLIAGVAKGSIPANNLIKFITNHFSEDSNYVMPSSYRKISPIKQIEQDCGGASIATWLAMAVSHLDAPAPWEIYEEYSQKTGIVSAISSFIDAKETCLLSEYIYKIGCLSFNESTTADSKLQVPQTDSVTDIIVDSGNQKINKRTSLPRIFILIPVVTALIIAGLISQILSLREQNMNLKIVSTEIKETSMELQKIVRSLRR